MANRQEIVCSYIRENYVESDRLRHDVISNKTQIFTQNGLACPVTLRWRDIMTTAEISDILVCRGSIKKPMPLSRLGMVLQQAGYQSKRVGKAGTRGWIVRERGLEEVNANRNIEGKG